MEKPLCKLCQTKHWSNEPHAFASKSAGKKASQLKPKTSKKQTPAERKAYLRDYMKTYMQKRRAKPAGGTS